jgi:hypothetical protein
MNERIKQLWEEAAKTTQSDSWEEQTKFMVRYTELVVRECIDKITTYDLVPGHSAKWEDIYDIHTRLLQDLGEELKEHFGVE